MSTAGLLGSRPAAVVFDVDGLLVDTEPCWTAAETELFARRGLRFGDEQKALLIGRGLHESCDGLAVAFEEPGRGPGAREVVEAAAARVPVGVASNSPHPLMEVALRSGGSAGRFPVNPGGKLWRPSPVTPRADPRGVSDADRAGQVQPWTPQTSVRQTPAALRPPRNTSETRADPYADRLSGRLVRPQDKPVPFEWEPRHVGTGDRSAPHSHAPDGSASPNSCQQPRAAGAARSAGAVRTQRHRVRPQTPADAWSVLRARPGRRGSRSSVRRRPRR